MIERQRIDNKIWNYQLLLKQYQIKSNRLISNPEIVIGDDFSGSDQIRSEVGNLTTASRN
jgi:hypothetical protein